MSLFLSIVTVLVFLSLVLVTAMRPLPSHLSRFELKRRGERAELARLKAARDIDSFLRVIQSLLLAALVVRLILLFGWVWGVILSLLVAIFYGAIAHIGFIQRSAQKLYQCKEASLVKMVKKAPLAFRLTRGFSFHELKPMHAIDSRQELQHLVDQSQNVLSADEKKIIVGALAFGDKKVRDIMTPRKQMESIKQTEFLGPLVLDELHKKGYSHLPVIAGSLDHVVGILRTGDLLTIENKRSVTAEKAMDARVLYVYQDDSLQQALTTLVHGHSHVLIVTNESGETVGLVTLSDVIEALIGRPLHEDLDL
jgi:CBS domain containing-hemolysin-like protein